MSELKSQYNKILQDFIKGSILVKLRAKRLYKLFAEWLHGKDIKPFEDLPFKEQKAWVFTAHKIPASVEWEDDDEIRSSAYWNEKSDDESVGHDDEEV